MKDGIKYDDGKPRIAEMVVDFKEPLLALCRVWEFGANKYEKSNWKKVDNGIDRYTNAMIRHLLAEEDCLIDDESNLLHASHIAFNALARLYFILKAYTDNGTCDLYYNNKLVGNDIDKRVALMVKDFFENNKVDEDKKIDG